MQWWQSVEKALNNLGGAASLGSIYAEVRKVRASANDSQPPSLDAIVRRELEYNSSDSSNWKMNRDIFFSVHGIGNGVWGLRSMAQVPPQAVDMDIPGPEREEVTISRIIRDTVMTRKIKALHGHACQLCGEWITLPDGKRYAEAHHLIPLGKPHSGPDIPANIIVVCPNHHAKLDFGCIQLKVEDLRVTAGHTISTKSISYHNDVVVPKMGQGK